ICGCHLRHGRRDGEHKQGDQWPADEAGGGARPGEAIVVEDHRAGQDRDDAEADGEVAEAAHAAEQLLGVAEAVQVANVLLDGLFARSLRHVGLSILPTRGWRLDLHSRSARAPASSGETVRDASFLYMAGAPRRPCAARAPMAD